MRHALYLSRRLWVATLSALLIAPHTLVCAESPPAVALVEFASDEGLLRLARSTAKVDFATLANQFEPQSNIAFCGPTTAAMVLNAMRARTSGLPRDASRLRPEDRAHLPPTLDPTVPRYTQDNVIPAGPKTRAQVLGEPVLIAGKLVRDGGYQLRQFDGLLRAHGLASRITVVDADLTEAQVRADLQANLAARGDYVVVNYRRAELGQGGGAHISPLGAYDAESDSVLVLDVNPSSAGWVWVPLAALVRAMRTFDTVENRGYLLVAP